MHHSALSLAAQQGSARTDSDLDSGIPERGARSLPARFPPDETVGMGYFPDELGLTGSSATAVSGELRRAS